MLDILIRSGWVADGTGNPRYPADVAIRGGQIVEVGRLAGAQATRVIDATGKIVCPGFVDAHSHTDWTILINPTAESTIRQGTTTEVVGNCGFSQAPLTPVNHEVTLARMRRSGYQGPAEWSTYREWLDLVARTRTSCNLVWLVGHGTVRLAASVAGPRASEEQFRAMESFVREAMEAGVHGISTGLEFEPGRQAPTEEIIRLAKVVGAYHGYYTSHIRNRDAQLQPAVEEFLEIVRQSGTIGEVSHLNVRHNTGAPDDAWQRACDTIERARSSGLQVGIDTTPFLDGEGQMAAILPPWVREGGPAATAERLKDSQVRVRLRTDCDRYWRFIHRGEWHRVRLASSAEFPEMIGKSFVQIAERWGKDPWDCFFDVLAAAGPKLDACGMVGRLFTEEHMADMVRHPLFSLGVDGATSRTDGPLSVSRKHPINYAGMTHFLTWHVREKGFLRLEEAIRKMTSLPATSFGLHDRGLVRSGHKADVVVFDFDRLEDVSTMENPVAYVKGVEHVLVNGVPVISEGEHTGARPGGNLLRR